MQRHPTPTAACTEVLAPFRRRASRVPARSGTWPIVLALLAGTHNPRVRPIVNRLLGMALLTALALVPAMLAAAVLVPSGLVPAMSRVDLMGEVALSAGAGAFMFFCAACLSDLLFPLRANDGRRPLPAASHSS